MKKVFIVRPGNTQPFSMCKEAVLHLVSYERKEVKITVEEYEITNKMLQQAKFHAMCGDVAKQAEFMGRKRSLMEWKLLFISAHAVATGGEHNIVPGLEGEFVSLRESTANMSSKRRASLIAYVEAWGAENGIKFKARTDHQLAGMYGIN